MSLISAGSFSLDTGQYLKGIDRPFRGGGREYTHSIPTGKLESRKFFLSYFKGPSSQDQQKTLERHLITLKSLWLVKVTLCWFLYSVKSLYAVTSTPYHECTRSHQLRTMNVRSLARGFFGPIAYLHGTELVWPHKVTLQSWCDRVHSRYGFDSIPQSHSKWFLCTLYTVH